MKRSGLKRRTGIRRTGGMPAGASLKRKPPEPRGEIVNFIWRRDLGPCVVCPFEGSECAGPVQGHHILSKELLRKRGLVAYLMDLRNRLSVCEHRHSQHTNKFKPIPREALPPSVFEFADELGLGWYLTKHYPATSSESEAAA